MALTQLLMVASDDVFWTAYPDPLRKTRDDSVDVCGNSDPDVPDHGNQWDVLHALLPSIPGANGSQLAINMSAAKSSLLLRTTLTSLRSQMRGLVSAEHFNFVDGAGDAFVAHGWCASGKTELDNEFWLLSSKATWRSSSVACAHNPSCWTPFLPMERWVRTSNDSFMTQQSYRNDGVAGTLHPNFRGQVAIAQSIAEIVDASR